ncbi:UbiA family prenyltransferase [bacterium]|nr:UbiA family prenyltransferase [bacterium]
MNQEWKNAFRHLRIHFSFLLLPVYIFALSQAKAPEINTAIWIFIILHILVYPASNAYNSFNDKDTGSIGGMKSPPPVSRKLLFLANSFDFTALILSALFVSLYFALLILLYILASRAYSYRKIRIKKYAVSGFLLVIVFQGGFTYYTVLLGLNPDFEFMAHIYPALAASLQIGAMYPLTQVYQHEEDKTDGVQTLSMLLGIKGTFYFSAIMFNLALLSYWLFFSLSLPFYLLLAFQLPIIGYFTFWFSRVQRNPETANFEHTSKFTAISATCLNFFYLILVII